MNLDFPQPTLLASFAGLAMIDHARPGFGKRPKERCDTQDGEERNIIKTVEQKGLSIRTKCNGAYKHP